MNEAPVRKPRLRYVEAIEIEHQGDPAILIRDPERLTPQMLAVPMPLFMVMVLFDGRRSAGQVQEYVTRQAGAEVVSLEQIEQIVAEMDAYFLLENERTAARRLELEEEYAALPARPSSHAGGSYPAEPQECREFFDGLFGGVATVDGVEQAPRGLIMPHIDFRVGGACIAAGMRHLPPDRPADLYVVLGVAHQPTRNLFTLTEKSYETPLGIAETDQAASARLRELYGAARLAGESAHRWEHSVEFSAEALKHRHGEAPLKILPILCGSLHEELLPEGPAPLTRPEVGEFVLALRRLVEEHPGRVCLVASVDLSHVGKKFGEMEGITDARAEAIRQADAEMLAHVQGGEAEAFFHQFRRHGNARHVDAVTAVYVMLHVLGGGKAGTLDYQQWHELETDSMVTFASLPIY